MNLEETRKRLPHGYCIQVRLTPFAAELSLFGPRGHLASFHHADASHIHNTLAALSKRAVREGMEDQRS